MVVDWIETYTGKKFYPQNPNHADIDIMDVAHSLSNRCRFSGATYKFYSVAQHSVHICEFVPAEYKLEALLHDAAEAYFPDIPSPLKPFLPDLLLFEAKIHKAVAARFSLEYPWPEIVIEIDREIVADEARCLLPSQGEGWLGERVGFAKAIIPWEPRAAERAFLDKYQECVADRGERRPDDPYHMKATAREHARRVVAEQREGT